MSEKDNPDDGSWLFDKPAPAKRNAEGLVGVKATMPGSASAPQQGQPQVGNAAAHVEESAASTGVSAAGASEQNSGSTPPAGWFPTSGAAGESASPWQALVSFSGKGWDFFKLVFVNLLLTLVTLGIYSFWGKTKVRQYLWGNSTVLGQPLEYTGTGKELFISFLIVMPIFLLFMFLFQLLIQQLVGNVPVMIAVIIVLYITLLFLALFAMYRTLRYRLTRTRWRGIRGNLSGSALTFAIRGTGWLLLMLSTLGLATPWVIARLARMQLNNVWFGDRRLQFDGPAKELVKSFFLMVGCIVAIFAVSGVITLSAVDDLTMAQNSGGDYASHLTAYAVKMLLVYVILIFGVLLCSAYYHATFYKWTFAHMTFGKLGFRSRISGAQVLKLRLTNTLLVLFTLGLGFAWAEMRSMRMYLHSLDYKGDPELGSLLQDTQPAPSRGEGLLDALDIDMGF